MKKCIYSAIALAALLSSCVNSSYDLSSMTDIDTEMNLGGQIEIPLPGKTTEFSYSVDDLLSGASESSTLKKGEDGSLMLTVGSDSGIGESYTFGQIQADNFTKNATCPFIASSTLVGTPVDFPLSFPISLDVSGIDGSVQTIREASLDAVLRLSVTVPSGVGASILQGYKFTLPEFIYVDESTLPSFASIDAAAAGKGLRNVIVINLLQTADPSFSMTCHIDRLDLGAFEIKNGGMKLAGDATASGSIEFDRIGLSDGVSFSLNAKMEITDVEAKSVTMKASPSVQAADQEIALDGVPDVLRDGTLDFTLADIGFVVTADNGTPFDVEVSAVMSSWKDGIRTASVDAAFDVAAYADGKVYCISESGVYGGADVEKVKVQGLAGLVSPVPDKITVSDINVKGIAGGDGYVTVNVGQVYDLGLSYRIEAPLAFSALKIRKDDLTVQLGVNLGDGGVAFDDLYIKAAVANSLPLDAKLSCTLLGEDGNPLEGVTLTCVDGNGNESAALGLDAGELGAPSVKTLTLKAVAEQGRHIFSLSALKLHIDASASEGKTAVLNAGQSLSVSEIVIGTTKGIYFPGNKEKQGN